MMNARQQGGIAARYLVSYDWPATASTQEILARLKGLVGQLGSVELPVLAEVHGKKKPITTDLFKIEDLSTIQSVETINEQSTDGALGSLFYSHNKGLNMAVLCIAIQTHQLQPNLVEDMIRTLHEVDGIGYAIAFDAILGKEALSYALGITFGGIKTHYEEILARELGRFFFQRTRKDRNERAYNRDKIRNVYPVNVLNTVQKRIMRAESGLSEGRFTHLDDNRHLLVLDATEVSGLREKLVGSEFLI